ncbi:hypothetical protein L6164_017397 [Bauhinia variegata]|uniref:Uncharacterized protein n=1 Tax=Bauhinia variegata TaxID=167791 RepID=A0ACB9N8Y6_BAUVA|nr:hypothetical protein L6164_017397 [Bauhinia variegata]
MYSNFKEQAIEYVKQAIQEDTAGNYAKAFPLYTNALEYFKTHLKYEKNPQIKEAITQKFEEYLRRAEEIRAVLDDRWTGQPSIGENSYVKWKDVAVLENTGSGSHLAGEPKMSIFNAIMETLTDANITLIGVCGHDKSHSMTILLEEISTRAKRDNLFDVVVKVTVKEKPSLERIQQEIANVLGISFQEKKTACCLNFNGNQKIVAARGRQLWERIKKEEKVLLILCGVDTQLDLAKIGISFGEDHRGCKVIVTSQSNEVLFQMHTQKNFFP